MRVIKILFFVILPLSLSAVTPFEAIKIHEKDKEIMALAGITVVEKIENKAVDFSKHKDFLFAQARSLLEVEHDVINAYKIMSYLALNYKEDRFYSLLGQCNYFLGELYFKGFIRSFYQKAYDIFDRLSDKHDENIEYLRWHSYAAAKVGAFIRHKERGKLSGLSFLKESVSVNDDILDDINKNDEDALLTEAEYQFETDSIPLFGGSKKKGLEIFHKVLRMNPNNMRVHILMGKYMSGIGQQAKALEYLHRAAQIYDNKLCPQNMVNYYARIFVEMNLSRVYNRLKDNANRFKHLSQHLAMLPRSPSGLNALAEFLSEVRKDKAAACAVAKRLVELEPYGRKEKKARTLCQ